MSNLKNFIKTNLAYFILLFFLVLIVYANSLNNGFVSDDILAIPKNPVIGSVTSFLSQPYAFVQPLLYSFAYKVGALNPAIYRLINIVFHLGTVWTIYLLFSALGKKSDGFYPAAIFAVHPILIESVGWISGGPYVRYSFFLLAALLTYIMSKKISKFYFISLTFTALGLFASEKAIVFPLILFLYEVTFSDIRRNWKRLIPFFLLSCIWISLYVLKIGMRYSNLQNEFYQKPVIYNPLIQLPIALTSYLSLIFWPDKLTLYHSEMSFSQVEYGIRFLITLGLLGGLGIFWKKNRLIFFWLSFFIVSLLPTLLPFGWSWIVAERYVYLGTIGVLSVVGYVLGAIIKNKKTEAIGYLIFILIILGLMTRTIVRNIDWKNEDNLWIATGRTSSSDPKTHNNLGDVYGRQGDLARSAEEFKTAIKLNPYYADAYHNLGNTYQQLGKTDLALKNYQQAIKYNPSLWQSYQNMAAIYFYQGAIASAEAYLNQAIKVNPTNALLYANLAVVYLKDNDKITAKKLLEKALEINPKDEQIKKIYISL